MSYKTLGTGRDKLVEPSRKIAFEKGFPMKIDNIEQLKKICEETKELIGDQLDCYIMLNYGIRSSKTFLFQEDTSLVVVNEIDGTYTHINSIDKLMTSKKTNIGKAMESGAFFVFDYEIEKLDIAKARKQMHQIAKAPRVEI